jgi:hypothetical protein
MYLRDMGCGGGCVCVEWIHLAQDRDLWRDPVNAVMNLRVLAPRSFLHVHSLCVWKATVQHTKGKIYKC